MRFLLSSLCSLLTFSLAVSQPYITPLSNDFEGRVDPFLNRIGSEAHTSVKPFLIADVLDEVNIDSLDHTLNRTESVHTTLVGRKLFREHLLEVKTNDYRLNFDFLPDWQLGKDRSAGKLLWLNTRGFYLDGHIGNTFSFRSEFYENQGVLPGYLDTFAKTQMVVPGQGFVHTFMNPGLDYAYASGLISYQPSRYFNFQFGHGKNFIGDGYRSMLLSDVAFNYPFLKMTTDIWKFRYINLYAQFQDLRAPQFAYDLGYRKKYGTFHYLSWNLSKRFSLGLFEALIWQAADSSGYRGFDVNYLNPIIFLRPVEFSVGSPDNALLGLNTSFKIAKHSIFYGQFLLDEFKAKEIFNKRGWWANKYAWQFGFRSFEVFNMKNLNVLAEFNAAMPYTYSQRTTLLNYGHYNEALAHPLGANFREIISIFNYRLHRFSFRFQANYAQYGSDSAGNVGKDIYKSYFTRDKDYGNSLGQGIKTDFYYLDFRAAYLFNPKTNLRVEAGIVNRKEVKAGKENATMYFVFGLRSSFRNFYYDF